TQGGPDEPDPVAIRVVAQRARVEWGQPPVLPARRVLVGRGTDAHPLEEELGARPDVRSARRGADRQVLIEAHPEPGLPAARGGLAELAVELELQPAVEVDLPAMRGPELPDRGRVRGAVLDGPPASIRLSQ